MLFKLLLIILIGVPISLGILGYTLLGILLDDIRYIISEVEAFLMGLI